MEQSGMIFMLRDHKVADLQRMHVLFGRVSGGLAAMRDIMSNHVKETGKVIFCFCFCLFRLFYAFC